MPRKYRLTPPIERVLKRTLIGDDCWLWQGARSDFGYGVVGAGKRGTGLLKAHRVTYEYFVGTVPEGLWVLHRCDVPACVKPSHLFLGTPKDNVNDAQRKGRHVNPPVHYGVNNPRHREYRRLRGLP